MPLTVISAPRCGVMRSQQPLDATQLAPAQRRIDHPRRLADRDRRGGEGEGRRHHLARRQRRGLAVRADRLAGRGDPRRNRFGQRLAGREADIHEDDRRVPPAGERRRPCPHIASSSRPDDRRRSTRQDSCPTGSTGFDLVDGQEHACSRSKSAVHRQGARDCRRPAPDAARRAAGPRSSSASRPGAGFAPSAGEAGYQPPAANQAQTIA